MAAQGGGVAERSTTVVLYSGQVVFGELRLGDVIDDFCVKCRRLTNHSVVSIVDGAAAKVRCRTCYGDHDYRNEQAPPSKKDLKKAALFNEVLAGAGTPAEEPAEIPVKTKKVAKKASKPAEA
jgi:hypothetical protein